MKDGLRSVGGPQHEVAGRRKAAKKVNDVRQDIVHIEAAHSPGGRLGDAPFDDRAGDIELGRGPLTADIHDGRWVGRLRQSGQQKQGHPGGKSK